VSEVSLHSPATCVLRVAKKLPCRSGKSVLVWYLAADPWRDCRGSWEAAWPQGGNPRARGPLRPSRSICACSVHSIRSPKFKLMHYLGRSERKRTGRPLLAALRQWVEVLRGKANGGTDLFAIGDWPPLSGPGGMLV
jgi:hypothetical protein